jgi:hypothetical protein
MAYHVIRITLERCEFDKSQPYAMVAVFFGRIGIYVVFLLLLRFRL